MADTRIKDLPNEPAPSGTDRMPIDSLADGTRSIPLSAVGTLLAVPAPAGTAPPAVAAAGATGGSTSYARQDHAHAGVTSVQAEAGAIQGAMTLSAGPYIDFVTTGNDIAIGVSGLPAVPSPAVLAPPDVAAAGAVGVSALYARSDHTHAGAQPAVSAPPAVGTGAVGVSLLYAREDHTHTATAGVSPAVSAPPAVAAASVVGASLLYAREDHTHAAPGATSFIYQPGGTAGTNTFTTVAALESAVAAAKGARRILIDTTYGAATFNTALDFVQANGPVSFESMKAGIPTTATFQTGATLAGVYEFRDMNLVTTSNAPVVNKTLGTGETAAYAFTGRTSFDTSSGTSSFLKVTMSAGTGTLYVNARDQAVFTGASGKEAVETAANVTATYTAYDRSTFGLNSLRNVENYTLNRVGPFAAASTTQLGAGAATLVTNVADTVPKMLVSGLLTTQQTTSPGEAVGGGTYTPSAVRPGGTYQFQALFYTTTGTAEVTLFDLTNNVTIATLTTTATSPDTQSVSLTIGSPGTNVISASLAKYEVRARFSAGSPGQNDHVVVQSAALVATYV